MTQIAVKTERGWEIETDGYLEHESQSKVYNTKQECESDINIINVKGFDELLALEQRFDE